MVFHLLCAALVGLTLQVVGGLGPLRTAATVTVATLAGLAGALTVGVAEARDGMPFFSGAERAATFTFVYLPVLLLGTAVLHRHDRRLRVVAAALAIALVGVGLDAFVVEPRALEVRTEQLEANVDAPLRIAILTDVQTDAVGAFEDEVFARLRAGRPDLVLFPGDYIQRGAGYEAEARRLAALISTVRPRLGAYAVRGDVEAPAWAELVFAGTGVRTTEASITWTAGPVTLTGLSLRDSADTRLTRPREGRFHVVFGHRPDFSMGDVDADLLVAGHTHGGQVQLPLVGPLVTFSEVPRHHAAGGRFSLPGGRTLVVSRGLGMERGAAPRVRFLCRPELVFVDVVPRRSVRGGTVSGR